MKIKNILVTSISTLILGAAIATGGILAHTNANVDKLDLLTRAVKDDKLKELKLARGDIKLAAGDAHAGAIIGNELYMWGNNASGQLGLGDTRHRSVPTLVKNLPQGTITQLELGDSHSAMLMNGKIYTWGSNAYGQLGLRDWDPRTVPTLINDYSNVTSIALGAYHSGAIINSKVYTSGRNGFGQLGLGNNSTANYNYFRLINEGSFPGYSAEKLSLGENNSGAIISFNNRKFIVIWGSNENNACGYAGPTIQSQPLLTYVWDKFGTNISDISVGTNYAVVIINGKAVTTGRNIEGQLGQNNTASSLAPGLTSLGNVNSIDAGYRHVLALRSGILYGWGQNASGELTSTNSASIYNYKQILGSVTHFAAGRSFSIAISNGKLYTWGINYYGQLGLGYSSPNKNEYVPTLANFPVDTTTINLNSTNDPNNSKNDIVYNIIKNSNNIRDIVEASSNEINLPKPGYPISNVISTGRTSNNTGKITLRIDSSFPIVNDITIDGFKPVNNTQATTGLTPLSPVGETFWNLNINNLVREANADSTGTNSKLSKWIISNYITNPNTYTQDFPQNTKITKVDGFEVLDAQSGNIKFNITVDKYYKPSGNDLILSTSSDPAIKLTNKIELFNLAKPISLEDCIDPANNNKIKILQTEINPNISVDAIFLSLTGNANGGLVNNRALLSQYLDTRFIPVDANISINRDMSVVQDPNKSEQQVVFTLTADKYFDKGYLVIAPLSQDLSFTINVKLSTIKLSTILDYDKLHNTTTGDALAAMTKNNVIDIELAKQYLEFKDFPTNTIFTMVDQIINENEKGILNLSINANKYYDDSSFTPHDRNKIFDKIEISGFKPAYDISKYPININSDHAKTLMANTEFYDKVIQNNKVDRQFLSQYVDLRAVPEDAKLTIESMQYGKDNSIVLKIRADKYYDNGGRTITDKPYEATVSIALPTMDINLIIILSSTGAFVLLLITCIIICIKNKNKIKFR